MNYICKYKTPEGFDDLVIVKTAEKLCIMSADGRNARET